MDGVPQIEMGDDCRDVAGIPIHIVAGVGLCRAAVAAPVMRDHAVALLDEVEHLRVPIVGAERPAVMEDNRLTGTPVFVEDLDAVPGGDRAHGGISVQLSALRRRWAVLNRQVSTQHDALCALRPAGSNSDYDFLFR